MIFARSRFFSSSIQSSTKPISVALPGPSVRADTPALQAFAQHLRNLTSGRVAARSTTEPHPPWLDTIPGSFGLLVQGRRDED